MILTPLEAARRRAGRFALWIAMCERRRQADQASLERAQKNVPLMHEPLKK